MSSGAYIQLAAPAARDLTTLARLKTELGITGSGEDAKLGQILADVRSRFARALDREPFLCRWKVELTGLGGHALRLCRWPVAEVEKVEIGWGDDPEEIPLAELEVVGGDRRDWLLWRDGRFCRNRVYSITCRAGWLGRGQAAAWQASTSYSAGAWASSSSPSHLVFEATAGGTSDSSEPAWPTVPGGTVADNDLTWTARSTAEVPEDLERAALVQAKQLYRGGDDLPMGVIRESDAAGSITYSNTIQASAGLERGLAPAAWAVLRAWR